MLRGLAGPTRSEQFDLVGVIKYLESCPGPLARNGPANPSAMILCATYFLMRELEVSAIDVEDVSFTDSSVSINLPVSKVDWAAKGCRRTWTCLCSKGYPCPVHVLKKHDDHMRAAENLTGPWFPDSSGNYCTKDGVVDTIRLAVLRSGGSAKDCSGSWIVSGHTFRITGARTLSAWGLDPVTIQLLGRWGSMAVLSYLAESPLIGFADRLRDPTIGSSTLEARSSQSLAGSTFAAASSSMLTKKSSNRRWSNFTEISKTSKMICRAYPNFLRIDQLWKSGWLSMTCQRWLIGRLSVWLLLRLSGGQVAVGSSLANVTLSLIDTKLVIRVLDHVRNATT